MRHALTFAIVLAACGSNSGAGSDGGGDDAPPGDGGDGDGTPGDGMDGDAPIVSNCSAGTWCTEEPPVGVTVLLHSVDAVDATDVFAVGDGGTILRRQNGTWSKMTSTTTKNLRGIWALSSTNAWAAGQDGTVLHWDGTNWTAITGGPPAVDYAAAWGSAANDVWFVGTGTAVHWNGTALTTNSTSPAITGTPVSISGVASNDIWIAAESGKLSHYTTSWQLCVGAAACAVTPNSFFAVAARTATDVWASLPGAGTMRWNGSTWTTYASGTTLFASISAPGANNAWGVGSTKVGHWDGSTWTISTPVTNLASSLYGVTGSGPHTWAVGADATILYHHD